MTRLLKLVESVIVTICLPFYALAWPFYRWGLHSAAKKIRLLLCASCSGSFADVKPNDLQFCSVLLRLTAGTKVSRDRLPKWRVKCVSCSIDTCFDSQFRITACNLSDAITRQRT